MNRDQYEKELKERQKKHLDSIQSKQESYWRPCMHDQCAECHGTGIKINGGSCIHGIACSCPKCSPYCQPKEPHE
jgi:hypothetical protein